MSVSLKELADRSKENPSSESDETEQEVSRLSKREAVRRRIAELQLRSEQAGELRKIIDSINAKTDAAAEQHRIKTEPLQSELAKLHEQQLAEIVGKLSPNADDTKRRGELLQSIADANSELEATSQANAATIKKVEQQIRDLEPPPGSETENTTTLQNRLCNELAPADLKNRMFALKERLKFSHVWAESARDQMEKCQSMLNSPRKYAERSVTHAGDLLARWQAVVSDAGKLAADAREELARLRTEAIDGT